MLVIHVGDSEEENIQLLVSSETSQPIYLVSTEDPSITLFIMNMDQ